MSNHWVTIGIATWNRRPLLQQAVESALAQTYPHVEIVISDDGSSDDTSEYLDSLSDPRITKIRKPSNEGIVANYNTCLRAATSPFFLLLNDDDILLPTAIERLVGAFIMPAGGIAPERIGIAWCPFTVVDPDGNDLWEVRGGPEIESSVDLIEGLFVGTRGPLCSGIMIRTADALEAGGYDPAFWTGCEDSDLWGKVCLRYDYAVCVNEPLMRYLMRPSGATANAQCGIWRDAMRQQIASFSAVLRERGDEIGAVRLARAANCLLANITVTVLMRSIGRPGFLKLVGREIWCSRRYLFSPFVAKRALLDGWKLFRLFKAFHVSAVHLSNKDIQENSIQSVSFR